MRKYVLNIDKFYSGDTANALVLNQVDVEMPVLLPSLGEQDATTKVYDWISDMQKVNPLFDPLA